MHSFHAACPAGCSHRFPTAYRDNIVAKRIRSAYMLRKFFELEVCGRKGGGVPKIAKLDDVLVQQHVLELEIEVHNVPVVEINEAGCRLLHVLFTHRLILVAEKS